MNWEKGIILAFVLFCGFIVTIVVKAFQEDFDLVSETYYREELNYESHIQAQANLLASNDRIAVKRSPGGVDIEYPPAFADAQGTITFYHPSRAIFDRVYDLEAATGHQQLALEDLLKGRYRLKMQWLAGGKPYYQEQEIFIR